LEGDRIADLRSRNGSLISIYAGRPSPGGFAALLSDLLRPIKEASETMGRTTQKSVRSDADRIHGLAEQLEMDSAPGYAIFASGSDQVFVVEPLDHPPSDSATIGPRPYMRPLRAAPRPLRSGLLIADSTIARTFAAMDGIVEEIKTPLGADIGNRSWGGFSGYEEHTVRGRADEATSRLWREAGERLLDHHMEKPFDYVAIGGHDETVDEIARTLHPYLARLSKATFTTNPQSVGLPGLRTEVAAMDKQMRQHRHSTLAGKVCDSAWSGGNAVLGLQEVIDAANAQAVDTLVVAGPFIRTGVICDGCGHLARVGEICSVCGDPMFAVDDVVGALMESVVVAGGDVSQIRVASPLDRHGVGALTRFPVPARR
jgi:peptide subunit release factor 1 (eRF1)